MTQIHWFQAVNGSFSRKTDWSGGVVPGASDDAILDATGASFTVTVTTDQEVESIQTGAAAALLLTGGANFTASAATGGGANAGAIMVRDGDLRIGGVFRNTGVVTLFGGGRRGAHTRMTIDKSMTLEGGGTIELSKRKGYPLIEGKGTKAFLTNVDNTIIGGGVIGFGFTLAVVNESAGVIDATDGNLLMLSDDRASVNAGLMEATNNGELSIFATTVDNTGGTISATGGGGVTIASSTISGGALLAGFGSTIEITGALNITDASLTTAAGGEIYIHNFPTVTVDGLISNAGTIHIGLAADDTAMLVLDGAASLSGGGMLVLQGRTIEGVRSGTVLTNVDNTILGNGSLGNGSLTLENDALGVIAASGGLLTIDTRADAIGNAGLVEATASGAVVVVSPIHNTGVLETAGGTATLDGAVTGKVGTALIDGGTLDFNSIFNQVVSFGGAGGELELALSQSYSASIKGFSKTGGTSLDLRDIAFASAFEATYAGDKKSGILTVTDGINTADIHLRGNFLSSIFTASSDGHGGTIVTASMCAAAHRFVAAVASHLASAVAVSTYANEGLRVQAMALARPEIKFA